MSYVPIVSHDVSRKTKSSFNHPEPRSLASLSSQALPAAQLKCFQKGEPLATLNSSTSLRWRRSSLTASPKVPELAVFYAFAAEDDIYICVYIYIHVYIYIEVVLS